VALGGLFSIAFAICYGRIGRFGPRATSALVAAGAFVAVELVPFLKYPANPPSGRQPRHHRPPHGAVLHDDRRQRRHIHRRDPDRPPSRTAFRELERLPARGRPTSSPS
jgi:hypothetical protein